MLDAGEPAILLGTDTGPNPAEQVLHALAACLTTSLVYVAAARGVRLTEVESTIEGDIDLRGALGLADEMRNGHEAVRVSFPGPGRRPVRDDPPARRAGAAALGRLRHRLPRRAGHGRHRARMIAMTFELSARTDAGRDLVALAERLSADSRPGPATTTARRPTRSRTSRRSGRPAPGTGS